MNDVERRYKAKGTVTKKVTVPLLIWEEWEEDCKLHFNNTYHLKMWYDHKYRHDMSEFINTVLAELNDLREHLFELKAQLSNQNNEQEDKIKTFGGEM